MKIRMQYASEEQKLSYERWDIGFTSDYVDKRGECSCNFIKSNSTKNYAIEYNPIEFTLLINGEVVSIDDISSYFHELTTDKKVILDCTTLGVVEMLLIIQILKNTGLEKMDALYVEPHEYKRTLGKIIHKRDFEITSEFEGYIGIPGHALMSSMDNDNNDLFVFFCGYESERIERAIEDANVNCCRSRLIFGVPAFHTGWEMNSFSNNIRVIDNKGMDRSFYYCGASNPLAVYEKLETLYRSIGEEDHLFIIPVGTKPMALGACIFKVIKNDNDRIAFLYDHPKREMNRSQDISKWNLYNIEL